MSEPDPDSNPALGRDWLCDAWEHELDDRLRDVLTRRATGETLADIGSRHGVTREAVRQLQIKAEKRLTLAQEWAAADLPDKICAATEDVLALPERQLASLVATTATTALRALVRKLGFVHPKIHSVGLAGWWTHDPARFDERILDLIALAPATQDEMLNAIHELGFPTDMAIEQLLAAPESPLVRHEIGWVRRQHVARDLALLWLRSEGEPRRVADIAATMQTSEHAAREAMRRDERFAQVRPEGTWALADWRTAGADNRYSSAVEAVVEVLSEQGPMTFDQLRAETQKRYPVSTWRVTQCLSNNAIGLTADGRYDLVERGASPIEDAEPTRPPTMELSGNLIGVFLSVDREVLRGSSIPVHRWLTWYLGLRTAPTERCFPFDAETGSVCVRRGTSNSTVSSLRVAVLALNLVDGCKIVLLLRLDPDGASIRHACGAGSCPAAGTLG